MPFYSSSQIMLHYVCRGPVAGESRHPVLVFEHGIGGDLSQPARFLGADRTGIPEDMLSIIHADFRGHGRSELGPAKELSIATLAGDLRALLDHLGIKQAIMGGISMGAAAALAMAVRWPERCQALILSRPAWAEEGMSEEAQRALTLVAELLSAEDWRETATEQLERSEILASLEEVCPDAAKSLRQQLRSVLSYPENRRPRIDLLRELPFSAGFDDLKRDLGRVSCPTLVLAAEGDPIHPLSFAVRIAEALPSSRLLQIQPKSVGDERSHVQEVDQKIGDFIRSLLQSPVKATRSFL